MDGSPSRDPVVVKKPFAVPRKKSEVRNDRGQDSSSAPEDSAAMALTMKSRITLNDGSKIPALGLGVWQEASGQEARKAVLSALASGNRLIDTAKMYGNTPAVAAGARESEIRRQELLDA